MPLSISYEYVPNTKIKSNLHQKNVYGDDGDKICPKFNIKTTQQIILIKMSNSMNQICKQTSWSRQSPAKCTTLCFRGQNQGLLYFVVETSLDSQWFQSDSRKELTFLEIKNKSSLGTANLKM